MRLAALIVLVGCSSPSAPDSTQSFHDAMQMVCSAHSEPNYLTTHLLNPEVVKMLSALGEANPADRRQILDQAIAKAGLSSCDQYAPAAVSLAGKAPVVADHGLVALDPQATVVVTPTGIVIEGKAIVSIVDGDVDPAEKEGGAQGMLIVRVKTFLKALASQAPPVGKLTLVLHPAIPYRLLLEVIFSAREAGFRELALAVTAGGAIKAIPLVLPALRPPGDKPTGIRPVVTITEDKLMLWSLSDEEGTLQKPKLVVARDRVGDVQRALAEIVARRWPGGTRGAEDHRIVVMIDGAVPMQQVADLMVAVRTGDDGKELFNDLLLSSGSP